MHDVSVERICVDQVLPPFSFVDEHEIAGRKTSCTRCVTATVPAGMNVFASCESSCGSFSELPFHGLRTFS